MSKFKKTNLLIIFGGKSAEHEVSVISARNIVQAIDKKKYDIFLIGIDQKGQWFSFKEKELLSEKNPFLNTLNRDIAIPFSKDNKFFIKTDSLTKEIDVVFPVLHGPYGEDGTIQGLLKLYNVPFVGPSVLGSAVGMDKDVSKRLLKEAGLPVADFLVFKKQQKNEITFDKVKKKLGLPVFIKPANLGSSVGISKVKDQKEFSTAIKKAFLYDNKIIIEKSIKGREIECAVLGNSQPRASIPGEIIPNHDFYSYEAKYLDENGASLVMPAKLPKNVIKKVQELAIKTFEVLGAEGMSRVDFFLTNNKLLVNEINTIPGFTSISMYPKLWGESGISYSALIDKLISLAIQRHGEEYKLRIER